MVQRTACSVKSTEYSVQRIAQRAQSTEYRVQSTSLIIFSCSGKYGIDRVRGRGGETVRRLIYSVHTIRGKTNFECERKKKKS